MLVNATILEKTLILTVIWSTRSFAIVVRRNWIALFQKENHGYGTRIKNGIYQTKRRVHKMIVDCNNQNARMNVLSFT